jgi:hypothetical protein
MIPERLKTRLRKDRPMTTITLRIPQALLKAYISEGLRRDEPVHVFGSAARLTEALRRRGVPAKP